MKLTVTLETNQDNLKSLAFIPVSKVYHYIHLDFIPFLSAWSIFFHCTGLLPMPTQNSTFSENILQKKQNKTKTTTHFKLSPLTFLNNVFLGLSYFSTKNGMSVLCFQDVFGHV